MPATTSPVRAADARRTETPNAVMTTLASPTQGGSGALSLWRVEMRAGQQGPRHRFDTEQIWTVAAGEATIEVGDLTHAVATGDTLAIPAAAERRVTATTDVQLLVAGGSDGAASVAGEDASRGTPPWIA